MSRYIITITPEPPGLGSQTTVRVDLSSGQPRVQELLVRSADKRGLASGDLPVIDFGLLISAVSGGTRAAADTTSGETASGRRRGRASGATAQTDRKSRSRTAAAARTGRRAAARPAAEGAEGAENGGAERAYRRMPEPDEVIAVYEKVGTITGLAEHFGVPRHTAQGWAGRLRRGGYQIGRG